MIALGWEGGFRDSYSDGDTHGSLCGTSGIYFLAGSYLMHWFWGSRYPPVQMRLIDLVWYVLDTG